MFRAAIQEETELGILARQYMDRGELVPDQLVVEMVAEALRNAPYDIGCLLDGFPRSLPQAEALDQILAQEGKQVDMVLELDVGDEILIERLLARKRPDDTLDTIRNRLKVYMEQTSPVLNYYKERRLLTTINGEGTMDDVHREILEQTLQKNE